MTLGGIDNFPSSSLASQALQGTAIITQDNHLDKKKEGPDSYDKFWYVLEQLLTPQLGASHELQDFAQIVCLTCDLQVNDRDISIQKLKSFFSIDQMEELLSLTEWTFLLERGRLPWDHFQKDKSIHTNLKKYLNVDCYIDVLARDITPKKEWNSLSLGNFCHTLEQMALDSHSEFETLKQTLISQCLNLASADRVLTLFVDDLKMEKSVAHSFQPAVEKMTLEMRVRVVLLASAIPYTLAEIPTHESLISPNIGSYASVSKEWHPLIEQFEHCLLELRKANHNKQFWSLMQFHVDNGYKKIVEEFSRVWKIDFQDFYGSQLLLEEAFSKQEIKELHHIVEWRYLLLQGRTTNNPYIFDHVKDYLSINHCTAILTEQDIKPKEQYNSISLQALSKLLAERASLKAYQSHGTLFTYMKNYCLDRINALLEWSEIARMLEKDLCLEKKFVDPIKALFDLMPLEMKLRTVALAKVVRFCEFTNLEEDLPDLSQNASSSIPGYLSSIYTLIDVIYIKKKKGLYVGQSDAPSWNYPSTPAANEPLTLLSLLQRLGNNVLVPSYSKLDLPGMPNWMPNGGNSCYISSSLWSIFFLLDGEIQSQIPSLELIQETDRRISSAKQALINLYKEISSSEDKKIPFTTINSLRALVHNAFPKSFVAPRQREQEDAYDFLLCILNLLSLNSFSKEAPEFQRRHSYPNANSCTLVEAEHYNWNRALSLAYSREALHGTVDIGLGERVNEPRTLSQLVTRERQTEDVEKNAYKIKPEHQGPGYRTVKVQHVEQFVVESEQAAPKYFIGRLARFRADSYGKNENKSKDIVIPNATLEFCVKGRESEAVRVPYDLVAITNHRGPTIHGGHYYTYCRKFQDGQWHFYKYDDLEQPSVCEDEEKVVRDIATNGYIFYYKKREGDSQPKPVLFENDPLGLVETKMPDAEKWLKSQNLAGIFSMQFGGRCFKNLMDLFATTFPESKDYLSMLQPENEQEFMSESSLVVGYPIYFVNPGEDKELQVVEGNICPSEPYCFGTDFIDKPMMYVFRQNDGSYVLLKKNKR